MSEVIKLEALLPDGTPFSARGREAWTAFQLIEAGPQGITPRDRPAPRWSCYVHRLRKRGLNIETLRERHAGAYAGRHGRYVLRTRLTLVSLVASGSGGTGA